MTAPALIVTQIKVHKNHTSDACSTVDKLVGKGRGVVAARASSALEEFASGGDEKEEGGEKLAVGWKNGESRGKSTRVVPRIINLAATHIAMLPSCRGMLANKWLWSSPSKLVHDTTVGFRAEYCCRIARVHGPGVGEAAAAT